MSKAFTLIELLVVIVIIAILIALLSVGISKTREIARDTLCKTHLHNFSYAYPAFAADHKDYMPGLYTWQDNGLEDWQRDVYSGVYGNRVTPNQSWYFSPQEGTLFSYLNTIEVYLCPSLKRGEMGSGIGSNGKFDYSIIGGWSGAKFDHLPITLSIIDYPNSTEILDTMRLMPIMIEEDVEYNLNSVGLASSFAATDQITKRHLKSSNYSSHDGSVQKFSEKFSGISAYQIIANTNGPIGRVNFATDAPFFGWWNNHWND